MNSSKTHAFGSGPCGHAVRIIVEAWIGTANCCQAWDTNESLHFVTGMNPWTISVLKTCQQQGKWSSPKPLGIKILEPWLSANWPDLIDFKAPTKDFELKCSDQQGGVWGLINTFNPSILQSPKSPMLILDSVFFSYRVKWIQMN